MSATLTEAEAAEGVESLLFHLSGAQRRTTAPATGPNHRLARVLIEGWVRKAEAASALVQPLMLASFPEPIEPVFTDVAEAMAWFEHIRGILPAAVDLAYALSLDELCWRLAYAAESLLLHVGDLRSWQRIAETGMRAAERTQAPAALSRMGLVRGGYHKMVGQIQAAVTDYQMAIGHLEGPEDSRLRILVINRMGAAHLVGRELARAGDCFELVLAAAHDDVAAGLATGNLASVRLAEGDYSSAVDLGERALVLLAGAEANLSVGFRTELIRAYARIGRFAEAAEHLRVSREATADGPAYRRIGVLQAEGELALLQGRPGDALAPLHLWLATHGDLGTPTNHADVLDLIGQAVATDDPARAKDIHHGALSRRRVAGIGYATAKTLRYLSRVEAVLGDDAAAEHRRLEALVLLDGIEDAAADGLRADLARSTD